MAFVQQADGAATASATSITSSAITTTLGNRLIAFVSYYRPAGSVAVDLLDSQGNSWNPIGTQLYNATDTEGIQCFEATVTTAGSTTFTARYDAGTSSAEYRGILVVEDDSALGAVDNDGDYNRQTSPGTGTDAVTSLSSTNSAQPARHIGFALNYNSTSTPNAGTGFTARTAVWSAIGGARAEDRTLSTTGSTAATFTAVGGGDTHYTASVIILEAGSPTLEQEGFRWGVDDGSESAHTWEASQDTNITIAASQSRLLRVLVDATGDPASTAYALRYQKNGTGGYVAVPVGSSSTVYTSPPATPTATVTTVGTAAATWNLNRPTASTGDAVVFVVAWDDSTNVTSVTAPAGPNGESAVSIVGPQASASTEMRMQAWYYVATGAWAGGTSGWTPAASETCRAVAFVVPGGEFNSGDVIGFAGSAASAGTAENTLSSPTGTAEADDGEGRLYIAFGSDVDAITPPGSNWGVINTATGGGVGLAVGSRTALVSNSESIAALTATIASDSWASLAFVVKPASAVTNNEVYVTTSANIAAGGEATTARLTAPASGSFVTGRRWDDENGTDSIDITDGDYTELEWLVALSSTPVATDYFEFRTYAGSNPLDTYTLTPRWTIPGGGGGATLAGRMALLGVGI